MLLEGGGDGKGHTAEPALEDVLSHSAVGLHVPRQLAALRAGVVTHPAAVGLLASVGPLVDSQVGAILDAGFTRRGFGARHRSLESSELPAVQES